VPVLCVRDPMDTHSRKGYLGMVRKAAGISCFYKSLIPVSGASYFEGGISARGKAATIPRWAFRRGSEKHPSPTRSRHPHRKRRETGVASARDTSSERSIHVALSRYADGDFRRTHPDGVSS
jgi:hypothetical protein